MAEKEEVIITRHGKPAAMLIGFASEDGWFEDRLEHDPRVPQRIEHAQQSLRLGQRVKLEEKTDEAARNFIDQEAAQHDTPPTRCAPLAGG